MSKTIFSKNIQINCGDASYDQCDKLLTDAIPDSVKMDSFNDYEGNIEWTNLSIKIGDDTLLIKSGYTGLWELASFNKLSDDNKQSVCNSLAEWLEYEYEYAEDEIHCEDSKYYYK